MHKQTEMVLGKGSEITLGGLLILVVVIQHNMTQI